MLSQKMKRTKVQTLGGGACIHRMGFNCAVFADKRIGECCIMLRYGKAGQFMNLITLLL